MPGLAPNFSASSIAQQRARTVGLLLHHQRVAINHIGAGIAVAFERHQFLVVAAQMRGAIENIGDEGRPPRAETNRMLS